MGSKHMMHEAVSLSQCKTRLTFLQLVQNNFDSQFRAWFLLTSDYLHYLKMLRDFSRDFMTASDIACQMSVIKYMPCRNQRYEVQAAADYLETIKAWVVTEDSVELPKHLRFIDARGHVLRSGANRLQIPISSDNDVVLTLRQYSRQATQSAPKLPLDCSSESR